MLLLSAENGGQVDRGAFAGQGSSEFRLQPPDPFPIWAPMEGADIAEQFSEDTGVLCRQFGLKFLQQLPSAGLAVHAALECQEVPQIYKQLIVFC